MSKTLFFILVLFVGTANGQTARSYFMQGTDLNNQGRYEEALENFNKAIEIDSNYSAAFNNRGFSKDKLMDFEGAIQDFNSALAYNRGDFCTSCCHLNLGLAYGKLNNLEEAIKQFEKAIELKPGYGEAYYDLGYAYHLMGEKETACENWELAIKYDYYGAQTMINKFCQ